MKGVATLALCLVAMFALPGCGPKLTTTGYVVASLGSPEETGVYQAKVRIGSFAEAITGVDGCFAVRGLRPGTYSATVSKAGYDTEQLTVVVGSDLAVDRIVLNPLDESRVDVTYGGAGIASLLDAASQVAASSVGATAFNPGTDPAHLEFVITVSLASENPEGPVQVYTSAAQLIADLQPPTVSNPFGSASVQWMGTLAIPCGDRSYDNYRLVATLVLSGFFGDETIPITTFSFEASVDFATGAIVNVVITGSELPPLPLAV